MRLTKQSGLNLVFLLGLAAASPNAIAEAERPEDSALCSPQLSAGQIEGYRCVKIAPGSPYDKAGLRDGDVIRSVDGSNLEDPLIALEKLGRLSAPNHGPISLVFEHLGHEVSKTVAPAGTAPIQQKQVN